MSEIVNIPLSGVSNQPSDYIADDGALSVSINAIKHNGSVRALMPGTEEPLPLPEGADVIAIHEVGNMKHWILLQGKPGSTTKAPAIAEKHFLYFVPLAGKVKMWWTSNTPSKFSSATMIVSIKGEQTSLKYAQIVEVPTKTTSIEVSDIRIIRIEDGNMVYEAFDFYIQEATNQDVPSEGELEEGRYIISYLDVDAMSSGQIAALTTPVISVVASGNVLAIASEGKPLKYAIWRDGKYEYLGDRFTNLKAFPFLDSKPMGLAELREQFAADLEYDDSIRIVSGTDAPAWDEMFNGKQIFFDSKQKQFVYDKVIGLLNSINNTLSQRGYFYAPFYVRFALRMFDGSHIMHTPPQLMIAGAAGKPILGIVKGTDKEGKLRYVQNPIFCASRLCADIELTDCDKWKDLITHVDVFVSAPLVDYSDAYESLKSAGAFNLSYWNEGIEVNTAQVLPSYNPLYMKNRREISNLYADYLGQVNQPAHIYYITLAEGQVYKNLIGGEKKNRMVLLKISGDTVVYVNGIEKYLKQASEDTLLFNSDATGQITLGSLGIENPSHYMYYQINNDTIGQIKFTSTTQMSLEVIVIEVIKEGAASNEPVQYAIDIQRTDGSNYLETIEENNAFYLAKSFKIEDLKNVGTGGVVTWSRKGDLAIDEHILTTITARKTLTDNGQMRERSIVNTAPMWYNNRISKVVDAQTLPKSTPIIDFCCQQYADIDTYPTGANRRYINEAWIECFVNGQTVYALLDIGSDSETNAYAEFIRYFYYPHSGAARLILKTHNEHTNRKEVLVYRLELHKLMNGAYAFNNFAPLEPISAAVYEDEDTLSSQNEDIQNARKGASEVHYGNMIKVSSVANPFHFNEANQVQLPSGKIIALSTTAKALSQGQFGAFPLYCFSDNGIWALEVSNEGTYSAKQPVSRAVCTNPKSITQTEGNVLFVTKRGLMSIDGSNVSCISEVLHGHNATNALDQIGKVMTMAIGDTHSIPDHVEDWLQEAQFRYDDKRQYLYAFREDEALAYVYSITDQAWGMMESDIAHPLPSYTDALVVTKPDEKNMRKVVNMSEYVSCGNTVKSLIVTRPMQLSAPDMYKTIEAMVARGTLDKNNAKLVVWASNDLDTWAIVGTSTTSWYRGTSGTPYKYYRVGILLDWDDSNSLQSVSLDITPRLNNRLR